MNEITREQLDNLRSGDGDAQNRAYEYFMRETEQPVGWAYAVWDEMVANLAHKDGKVRAIASQVMANLAKSDPDKRMLKDFDALLLVTKDDKFVTARHCLQSLWKIGVAGEEQSKMLVEGLERRFNECLREKNWSLIRYDILVGLRTLYDAVGDETVKEKALALIETEGDTKYKKKYAGVWRKS